MSTIKIYLIDDHQIILDGIRLMLGGAPGLTILGTSGDAETGLQQIRMVRPDIVIADISLPGMNGIKLTEQIRQELPDIRIIILSMHATEDYICSVVKAGAHGYLTKQGTNREELVNAIESVMRGEDYFSPDVSKIIMRRYVHKAKPGGIADIGPTSLTAREKEIISMYADGFSNQEIADKLCISIKTVDAHKNNIMQKFRFKSTVEMVKYAIRNNLTEL
jgi:DNA-binding NarL/FixJ family response regulator